MGMDTVAIDPQPEPKQNPHGSDITALTISDLKKRSEAGAKKYGTVLKSFNGRNAVVDAYQEALDLALYLRQKIDETDKTTRRIDIKTRSDIKVDLVQYAGGDAMICNAARVSKMGSQETEFNEKANAGLINFLMKHRHGTPFEHGMMTFAVEAPIFVWREWHRHRIGHSFNEESARYKQLDPVFWVPKQERKIVPMPNSTSARPEFQQGNDGQYFGLVDALKDSYQTAYSTYSALLGLGIAREVARACLPVAIYSSCYVTVNPRSMMAFLSLRTHDESAKFVSYPQAEIEEAARQCESIFGGLWPQTYKAFVDNGRVAP